MVPEPEIRAESHRTGHRRADLIIALCALFISLCSLGLALHQGIAMDRLVEANSRPVLEFQDSDRDPRQPAASPPVLSFSIDNPGAGTARLEWLSIGIGGRETRDWRQALLWARDQAVAGDAQTSGSDPGPITTSVVAPAYIKYGGSRVIFAWPRSPANATLWDIVDRFRRSGGLRLTACYCSIFDQCWRADSRSGTWPEAVRSCR
jgi:hypothetical protein